MSGIRQALLFGAIPIGVGIIYLLLQVAFAMDDLWVLPEGDFFDEFGNVVGLITGTMDPAGVTLLIALGLAMGFGMFVILRGARDL